MRPVRALLFDLDHTLFDTERTERRALRKVASEVGVPLGPRTVAAYKEVNLHVWSEYRAGRITSKELRVLRFEMWLARVDRSAHDPTALARLYLNEFSSHGDLITGTRAAMRTFRSSGYRLGVVTNGIDRVQRRRLEASGLKGHFHTIVTSERAGITKPDPRIIELALKRMRIAAPEAVYVGDDPEVDGLAANRASVRFAWFNPLGKTLSPQSGVTIDYEISHLHELHRIVIASATHSELA